MTRSTSSVHTDEPRPNVRARFVGAVLLTTLILTAAGCQTTTKETGRVPLPEPAAHDPAAHPGEPVAQISNTDPCAMRLHDICEPLLLYYVMNHRLPDRLEDLRQLPDSANLELTCPVSHKKYLYNPVGLLDTESKSRVILYDAAPSHSGMRWAVSIIEPEQENGPLVTKVIALPESHFTFMGR